MMGRMPLLLAGALAAFHPAQPAFAQSASGGLGDVAKLILEEIGEKQILSMCGQKKRLGAAIKLAAANIAPKTLGYVEGPTEMKPAVREVKGYIQHICKKARTGGRQVRIPTAQMKPLMTGTSVAVKNRKGKPMTWTFAAHGRLSGQMGVDGEVSRDQGKWWVNKIGALCFKWSRWGGAPGNAAGNWPPMEKYYRAAIREPARFSRNHG